MSDNQVANFATLRHLAIENNDYCKKLKKLAVACVCFYTIYPVYDYA